MHKEQSNYSSALHVLAFSEALIRPLLNTWRVVTARLGGAIQAYTQRVIERALEKQRATYRQIIIFYNG